MYGSANNENWEIWICDEIEFRQNLSFRKVESLEYSTVTIMYHGARLIPEQHTVVSLSSRSVLAKETIQSLLQGHPI